MKVLITPKVSDRQLNELRKLSPNLQVVYERDPEKARREFRDAEILFAYQLPGPLEEATALRWIQLNSAGANHVLNAGARDRDIVVTTVSGIHAIPMSEYVLWAMLTLARRMQRVMRETGQKQWRPGRPRAYYGEELSGKTLGILGLGSIGRQVARVASCLGMHVIGLRRSGRELPPEVPVEKVYRPPELLEMLGRCDFVVVVVPLTEETTGLLGEDELRAMKPGSYLINVARGEVVQEEALARALREEWIAGAVLDVFDREPLPAESPLWDVPNLVITPHMAGDTLPYMERATEVFLENLRRYMAGESMTNVVDKARGY